MNVLFKSNNVNVYKQVDRVPNKDEYIMINQKVYVVTKIYTYIYTEECAESKWSPYYVALLSENID